MNGIIYKATNIINGKVYIGQTIGCLDKRIWRHCSNNSGCLLFKNAIKKYGKENFIWEILIEIESNELDSIEQKYISEYKSNQKEFGYNIREGGKTGKFSEETKQKMSESAKRYCSSNPEITKNRMNSIREYLKKHPDAEQNRVEKIKKTCSTIENKKKNSERKKEYFITHPEAAKNHSEKLKITFSDPKYKEEASKRTIEYFDNPENREKARQKSIEQFSDPKQRENAKRRATKQFSNRENRIKISRANGGKSIIAKKDDDVMFFDMVMDAAKYFNVSHSLISMILHGKRSNVKGWFLSFIETSSLYD